MEEKEVKRLLYEQKPEAYLNYVRKGHIVYMARIYGSEETVTVVFAIPVDDIGDTDFLPVMPSPLLIKWIYTN